WVTTVEEINEAFLEDKTKAILVANLQIYRKATKEIHELEKLGVQKYFITEVVEYWLYRIPLSLVDEYRDYYELFLNQTPISQEKRFLDIGCGLIMGLIGLPFIVLFGILVVLNSGFPIIFKQERIGLYEGSFMF